SHRHLNDAALLQSLLATRPPHTLIPGRKDDSLGLAYGFAALSPDARADIGAAGGDGAVSEMVLEATYQCVLTPWCILQPDAQLIVNPGGDNSAPNAFVIGARVAITF
ncbi:MAG: carbohydrate porin, partial [Spartobacteria bacterium]